MPPNPNPITHHLPPTPLIPNSPHPLLHYPLFFSPSPSPATIHAHFARHAWLTHWIFRYGPSQPAHYHSTTHECMAVLSGSATIRFGAADDAVDEGKGIEIQAETGDVFVVPAGVAHKTFGCEPGGVFELLTPGDGRGVLGREEVEGVRVEGFCMLGAYPEGYGWDFRVGGEDKGGREAVWGVERPGMDPVVGGAREGLCGLWGGGWKEEGGGEDGGVGLPG